MSGLDPELLWDYMPTKYMGQYGDEARAHRKRQLHTGYLTSTPQPEVAQLLADQYELEDRTKAENYRRMVEDTGAAMPRTGALSYIDDAMRVLGNKASFGIGDHLEGLTNSLLYDTDVNDALGVSSHRTHKARKRLGDYVGAGAAALGTLGGYAALLPYLPAGLAGTGMLTPAAIPLEGARGYFETQGDPSQRLSGAAHGIIDDPMTVFAPRTGRGIAAQIFYEPLMQGAGLGDLTPSSYLNELWGAATND